MIATHFTDQQLVSLYADGNEKALSVLFGRHKDRIYSTIFYLVKDQHLAEDIFQDTLLRVVHTLQIGKYNDEGKFLPWVLRIAHNLCMDYFRKSKRMPAAKIPVNKDNEDEYNIFYNIKVDDDSIDVKMYKKQAYSTIRELIEALPDDQKQTLALRHYADMSFKEIGNIMGVNVNTALGRMRYAIINMRKIAIKNDMAL
jgi:RNA polymerase sigma-70 factor (ECF subfamily)